MAVFVYIKGLPQGKSIPPAARKVLVGIFAIGESCLLRFRQPIQLDERERDV